ETRQGAPRTRLLPAAHAARGSRAPVFSDRADDCREAAPQSDRRICRTSCRATERTSEKFRARRAGGRHMDVRSGAASSFLRTVGGRLWDEKNTGPFDFTAMPCETWSRSALRERELTNQANHVKISRP